MRPESRRGSTWAAAELHDKEWHAVMSRHDHMPWDGSAATFDSPCGELPAAAESDLFGPTTVRRRTKAVVKTCCTGLTSVNVSHQALSSSVTNPTCSA